MTRSLWKPYGQSNHIYINIAYYINDYMDNFMIVAKYQEITGKSAI